MTKATNIVRAITLRWKMRSVIHDRPFPMAREEGAELTFLEQIENNIHISNLCTKYMFSRQIVGGFTYGAGSALPVGEIMG